MLFNSYPFLFVFLPVTLVGYQIAGHFHRKAVVAWLGLMSLVFYACWHPAFLVVLLLSVAVNYTIAGLISRNIANQSASRGWLWVGILLNLGALGYFKYFVRILNFASYAAGSSKHWADIVLPLGISFFTFTQIAYLVDLQQGVATLCPLRDFLSASDCRANPPPQGDDAPVPAEPPVSTASERCCRGSFVVHHGPG
jgi:D-alanyl-lipoteichoic acid acyltransferase DltB (MBOAT superfamily)